MESRSQFSTIADEHLRSTAANSIDTGSIPTPVTSQNTNGSANRGIEANTSRQVGSAPEILNVTHIEYGASADAPIVEGFKVHEGY